jgi:hypothetical protein
MNLKICRRSNHLFKISSFFTQTREYKNLFKSSSFFSKTKRITAPTVIN